MERTGEYKKTLKICTQKNSRPKFIDFHVKKTSVYEMWMLVDVTKHVASDERFPILFNESTVILNCYCESIVRESCCIQLNPAQLLLGLFSSCSLRIAFALFACTRRGEVTLQFSILTKLCTSDACIQDAYLLVYDGVIMECNDTTVTILGRESRDEILYRHPSAFSPPYQHDGRKSEQKSVDVDEVALRTGFNRYLRR